jgi:hypothetical protein
MGTFSEETLKKFNEMCAAGLDFSEKDIYNFARCLMSNGEVYGVSDDEACEVGRRIGDNEKIDKGVSAGRLAKLKQEFIKKIGREMTKEEKAKLTMMLGGNKGKSS